MLNLFDILGGRYNRTKHLSVFVIKFDYERRQFACYLYSLIIVFAVLAVFTYTHISF